MIPQPSELFVLHPNQRKSMSHVAVLTNQGYKIDVHVRFLNYGFAWADKNDCVYIHTPYWDFHSRTKEQYLIAICDEAILLAENAIANGVHPQSNRDAKDLFDEALMRPVSVGLDFKRMGISDLEAISKSVSPHSTQGLIMHGILRFRRNRKSLF